MRIFALLAALAAFAEAIPQPTVTPAKTKPHYTQASPEISPAPQSPPIPYHLQEYRELLKRSTLAFEKKLDEPCPVDCNNGFCCPSNKVCLSQNSDDKVSVICGHPELRKRQDIDALPNPYTFFDFNSLRSSLTSELAHLFPGNYPPASTNDAKIKWLGSSITASITTITTTAHNPSNTSIFSITNKPHSRKITSRRETSSTDNIAGEVVGGIVVVALIIGVVFCIRRRRTQGQPVPPKPDPAYVQPPGPNPEPETVYYQPAVPGAVEADGVGQPMLPQYMGNSQQQQQQQPYPPPPQYHQQPGAVYHEMDIAPTGR